MNNFLKRIEHSRNFWFLLIISFAFFLMRLPSFFEPYWYGDEGVYEVLGYGMRHGRLLYQGIWDNKPPLLYLIYALFDGNQPAVRLFSFGVGIIAIYFFFALTHRLFEKQKSIFIATGLFALLLGLPLLEGNIANAENFMVLPAVVAAYLVVYTIQEKKQTLLNLFIAGFLLGVSFLIKVVAVFDFASFFLIFGFVFFAWNKKIITQLLFDLATFSIGFLMPLVLTIGFFAYKGILATFIQSAFLSNIGYVNYGNQFIIPQGFLIIKLLALFVLLLFLFFKRKTFSLLQLVIYIWLPFSLFNAFFSQRPYTHYMLVLIASFCLLFGMLANKKWLILHSVIALAIVALLATNFWFYVKIFPYYQNFTDMLLAKKTVTQYQSFFDKGVPRDYAIAQFFKQNLKPNQTVFLWTNSPQIYYLMQRLPLGRYTVAYHMTLSPTSYAETQKLLGKMRPDFIVVLPNASSFPFAIIDYRLQLTIDGGLIYEKTF